MTASAGSSEATVRTVLLFGVLYFLVGRFFPQPANNLEAWRLAALIVCGGVYAAHFCYEHFRLRNPPRVTAVHIAAAVAIGGFALAVAGMLHSLSVTSTIRPNWLLALVIWPAATAVPAFLGAIAAGTLLRRIRPAPSRKTKPDHD